MLKIWGRKTSANVQKVLWCCAELDLPFERVDWGGEFKGNDEPAYRAMNPNGRVPTIENGRDVVWESNSCIRYICNLTPGGDRLYPRDAYARSQVERWMDWQLATVGPPMAQLHMGLIRTPPEKRNPAALDAARTQAAAAWTVVDGALAGQPFLAGSDLSLADICNGILAYRWHAYAIERPGLPRMKAWLDRLAERPGFQSGVAGPLS